MTTQNDKAKASSLRVSAPSQGQLWHTIRNSNGTWQPSFGLIERSRTTPARPARATVRGSRAPVAAVQPGLPSGSGRHGEGVPRCPQRDRARG